MLSCLALATAGIWLWAFLPQPPVLRVTFLDVGEGDAAVIFTPGGQVVLIDSGPGPSEEYARRAYSRTGNSRKDPRRFVPTIDAGQKIVLPFLRKMGVSTLDAAIVTHPHDDHVGGMPSVLQAVELRTIVDCGEPHPSPGYARLLKIAERKRIPIRVARRGDRLRLRDLTLKVLNPPDYRLGEDLNNRSIVLRFQYGQTSFLLTGDAGREAESDILAHCAGELESTVLKVAHHGADEASTEPFLAAVHPRIAVISVGRNSFGHPDRETIQRLERCGARIYRTDRSGGITMESDGKTIRVSVSRVPSATYRKTQMPFGR